MVTIDLDRVNAGSPYLITAFKPGSFWLKTDAGVIYFISFMEDDILWGVDSYELCISNTNNKKSPRDPKLKESILAIVYEFFECSQSALLYICDTGDDRQQMRQRLFSYWFNTSPRKRDFAFLSVDLRDNEGVQNYAAVIVRMDNPNFLPIIDAFNAAVKALHQK